MADNEKHMDTSTIDYYNRNYDVNSTICKLKHNLEKIER